MIKSKDRDKIKESDFVAEDEQINDKDFDLDLDFGSALLKDLGFLDPEEDDDDNEDNITSTENDLTEESEDVDYTQEAGNSDELAKLLLKEDVLKNVWQYREQNDFKVTDGAILSRPISKEDIEYLSNYIYPFLKITSDVNFIELSTDPEFIVLNNGWVLFSYKNAIFTSSSTKNKTDFAEFNVKGFDELFLYEEIVVHDDVESNLPHKQTHDETTTDSGSSGGIGTIVKQQFEAVLAMIEMAKMNGWDLIVVKDGSSLMKFYAWVIAQELGLRVTGFVPDQEQERRYKIMAKEKVIAQSIQQRAKRRKYIMQENNKNNKSLEK